MSSQGNSTSVARVTEWRQSNPINEPKEVKEKINNEVWDNAYETLQTRNFGGHCVYLHQQEKSKEGVKEVLKSKWGNVALVSALLLSVSLPTVLTPPTISDERQADWGDDVTTTVVSIYGVLMSSATICFFLSIIYVFQMLDALGIHTATETDIIYFVVDNVQHLDIPQNLMFIGSFLFFAGLLVGLFMVYKIYIAAPLFSVGLLLISFVVYNSLGVISRTAERTKKDFREIKMKEF